MNGVNGCRGDELSGMIIKRVRPAKPNRARQWRVPLCETSGAAHSPDADGAGVRRCERGLLHGVLVD